MTRLFARIKCDARPEYKKGWFKRKCVTCNELTLNRVRHYVDEWTWMMTESRSWYYCTKWEPMHTECHKHNCSFGASCPHARIRLDFTISLDRLTKE